jgi:hypothetical protein
MPQGQRKSSALIMNEPKARPADQAQWTAIELAAAG